MRRLLRMIMTMLMVSGLMISGAVYASDDIQSKADLAVGNVLFDYDAASEFATYSAKDDGMVDIVFASNTPDALYSEILGKLEAHPDIKGVLAGRGGPPCSLW